MRSYSLVHVQLCTLWKERHTTKLQQTIVMRCEETTQLTRFKESWNQMKIANGAISARLNLVESAFTSERRDASTRLNEDLRLRSELAACLARETVWKQELQAARLEIQRFFCGNRILEESNPVRHSLISERIPESQ